LKAASWNKNIKSILQEEVNGGATTGKWDRMKVAGQGGEIE